ncbi:U6 small nuclear RNA (adenine-(43)-N(6))-methyltransferase [Lachnellula suecica]|uniref:U6 small nuclear RNA (Adenine-(43)-N(6))-methyltransferase n=1 Tax=Lachnellula suecica TaxID=602035 RepID=A0A8T9C5Y0_9HELO|nr:U6 small nuclear RNA (adenine-(43)-N(6))-methyltransferase [Lachnellula suecica]
MSTTNNIYKEDVDFAALALQDADFAKILKPNGQLDFSNPESVQQLTKSLLKRDFGLKISLPPDRLCPPIPNRLNYLLWIQALLDTTSDGYTDVYDPEREVLGLDIGTGASCIYPMLGCAQRPNWRFAATDIDDKSMQFAKTNVQLNSLQNRIKLLQTQKPDPLLPLDMMKFQNINFSMCNPPFYTSTADMLTSAAAKQRPPFTACTGSESEMVTLGGEVQFVSRMITESLVLKDRVQWYTSMLGKFSSVSVLLRRLRDAGVGNYAVTEFVQGSRTKRWGIAWSFADLRPKMALAREVVGVPKNLLPFPAEYHIPFANSGEAAQVGEQINSTLEALLLKWMWKPAKAIGLGFSDKAVWSRAARRQQSTKKDEDTMDEDEDEDNMALGFKIHMEGKVDGQAVNMVTIRWIKGHDSVLFGSFCGMLKRKLESARGPSRTQSNKMATTNAYPPGGTFLDTLKKSFTDVPVDKEKENAVSTTEFLEATESLTTLFGKLPPAFFEICS